MIKKKEKTSGEVICDFFKIEPETIYQDYSCSCLSTAIIFFGRLYVGQSHFCFNSYMFGISKRFSIKIQTISKMQIVKNTVTGSYLHRPGQERTFTFSNFVNITNVYKLMYGLWKGQQIEARILTTNDEEDSKQRDEIQMDKSMLQASFFSSAQSSDQMQTIAQITFPCTVQQYYDYFLAQKPTLYGVRQHMEMKEAQNIQISEWKKNEELQRQVREIRAYIKVEKVPMLSRANLHQIQTLKRQQNGDINIENVTQMADVPYASYFNCQEQITIKAHEDKKCKLKVNACCIFNKSSYLKKMIQERTINDLKKDYELWLQSLQENLDKLKLRSSKSFRKDSSKNQLDRSVEYEKAQSATWQFSTLLEDSGGNLKNLDQGQLRKLHIKINILIGLVAILIVMQFTKAIFL